MDIFYPCLVRKARLDLAMQEFAPDIGPELMQQILAGVAQKGEAYAGSDRMHSLTFAWNIKVRDGT